MGLILDTNVFIHQERSKQLLDLESVKSFEPFFISSITVSELLAGVHLAANKKIKLHRLAFVEEIISRMPILDFTPEIARTHSELHVYLIRHGKLIGAHDLIIAATAVHHGHAVLTRNVKEFKQVP